LNGNGNRLPISPKLKREGHANHRVAAQQEKWSHEKEIFFRKRIDLIGVSFHPAKDGKSRLSSGFRGDAKLPQEDD
jgi:hypothetical protein